jgi:hypothetical protein
MRGSAHRYFNHLRRHRRSENQYLNYRWLSHGNNKPTLRLLARQSSWPFSHPAKPLLGGPASGVTAGPFSFPTAPRYLAPRMALTASTTSGGDAKASA